MSVAYPIEFADAVLLAARGEGASLAALLRSDLPLGAGEREMLADLIAGELRAPKGKRAATSAPEQRAIAAEYIMRTEAGEKGDAVLAELTDRRTAASASTIKGWVRQLRAGLASAPDSAAVLRSVTGKSG